MEGVVDTREVGWEEEGKPKLALEDDVAMSQVIELSSKLLIGRFYGRFLLESKLLERIERCGHML